MIWVNFEQGFMKCELVPGKCGSIVASLEKVVVLLIIDLGKMSIFLLGLKRQRKIWIRKGLSGVFID